MDINRFSAIKFAFLFVVFCNVVVDIAHKVFLQNIAFKIFDGSSQVVWISIINALIIIPFLLLFTVSGYLSDRYEKKDILIYGGISSFTLSCLMVFSYLSENFYFAMFTLLLLAVQAAIYSPAKFGLILDIYGKKNLSRGNATLQAISIVAILFSIASASFIFESFFNTNHLETLTTKEELLSATLPLTYYILPVSFMEMLFSLLVLRKLKTNFSKNENLILDKKELFTGKLLTKNIKIIHDNNIVFLSVVGLSIFWGVSQATMAVYPSFAKMYMNVTDVFIINGVIGLSGIGIAIGSVIYSKVSKHYIEVGTIPLATLGMALSLYFSTTMENPIYTGICFLFFGIFGGLFVVPLNSLIQFNVKKNILGTVLAGNNWFQSLVMFLMLCMTTIVSLLDIDPLNTIYIILFITIVGSIYTIYKLPQSLILLFLKMILGLGYKLEVSGIKNIPSSGGVLLLGNHISWIDWAVVLMATPREVRFVMDKAIYNKWLLTWILKIFKCIPISTGSSKQTMRIIAKELDEGNMIVLFPEGAISRNGHLGEFKKGFEKILELTTTDVKVIPFYIKGLWESAFSRANEKFRKNNKTKILTISFAKPLKKEESNIVSIKEQVIKLSTKAWNEHLRNKKPLNEVIFDRLNQVGNSEIFADSTGSSLSGYKFLTASILFKNLFKSKINEQNIGVLLPSTNAGALANYTLAMMGKTIINLNYTAEINSLKSAIKDAQIKTLITSKKFVERLQSRGILIDEVLSLLEIIYLEDLKPQISKNKSIFVYMCLRILPIFILKALHLTKTSKDDTVLILFSSGSEGTPKGVELSGDNILGNALQISNIINANNNDTIVGSLPLFHAFGIVVTTFMPLIEGIKCVAHPDPTDGFGLGKLIASHKATIMCGTSTFFRLYTKNSKLNPLMFESLRLIVAGAEKLRADVRSDFKNRFGKDILEGFGTTETSPVATCNLPDILAPDFSVQIGNKIGTVGMPIPGTTVKIVDPQTFEPLKTNEEGMIVISGVQVMKGYLNNPKKTAEVLKNIDGKIYYVTGDKGRLDEDGFLTIVDRYSRFAKLAGEMISLSSVEEKISNLIDSQNNPFVDFVVTSIEDEKKGEKIILLISNVNNESILELKEKILRNFENKLMIPSEIKIISEIPKLGSGKKDYNKSKVLAKEVF